MNRYTRKSAAHYLTVRGRPTSPATLATLATRGGGPAFFRAGRFVFYQESDLEDFLRSQIVGPFHSTSTKAFEEPDLDFDIEQDLDDVPRNTNDPAFDEITRLLEDEWNCPIAAQGVQ